MSKTKDYLEETLQQEELASKIQIKLQALGKIRTTSNKIKNAGHTASFLRKQEVRDQFNTIHTLADSINEQALILQPRKVLENLNLKLNQVYASFYEIRHFIEQDSGTQLDDNIRQLLSILESPPVNDAYQQLSTDGVILSNNDNTRHILKLLEAIESELKSIVIVTLSSLANAPDFKKQISELKALLEGLHKNANAEAEGIKRIFEQDRKTFQAEMKEEVTKAKQATDAARRTALEAGVAKHYDIFEREAKHHNKQSWIWFGALLLIIIAAVGYIIYLMEFAVKPDYNLLLKEVISNENSINVEAAKSEAFKYELAQYIFNKILIISTLFYLLSICARNYKAHRHNHVVNKHRHNALATFQSFTNAATDQQTKNAILLEATHSIFSSQHTGYMGADAEAESPNKIIEIIKSTNGK
ncbi:hypothetical protein H9Q13_06230 [Pontibacter sp. JH31]|uniref:Uncharacterized protein n=1 Tax=Pontibacter aquaedesilientis TaxID=2766980 RepID=A0ABR7XEN6_9BACT|nr:hypothetical protein [Pontibacter aquaedesilientis]MBD1396758.1 hypothetical protein [Pontibacter aquaedesilientis]